MKKKFLSTPLFLLCGVLLFSNFPSTVATSAPGVSQNHNDLIETTVDFENERSGIEKINARNAVIVDETLSVSNIFIQYAYSEEENAYYLRFATAIKGNIETIEYTRSFADNSIEDATFTVEKVYQGIKAGNSIYFYNDEDNQPTTDTAYKGQYYWACYTARFVNESNNIAKDLNVSLSINGEVVKTRDSVSLFDQLTSQYETLEEEFNIMSFNIRVETTSDTGNKNWSARSQHLIDYILESGMDVVCFQEVKESQYQDLRTKLNEKYDLIYFAREKGNDVSENPEGLIIAYDNTFELVEQDVFWLSATPDKISMDWGTYVNENGETVDYQDDQYYRICANALLCSDKGVYLDVYNAHLGLTTDARKLSADLIIDRMNQKGYPSVVMGDFNAQPTETECYGKFAEAFQDCQQVAEITEKEGTGAYTFNGWSSPSRTIDYIFASDEITPMTFDVNQETWEGNLYSDHYAIDTHVKVEYTRELLKNIRSIEFNGDVEIVSDNGTNKINEEVIATYFDGTTSVLPREYYTIDLPDNYNIGEEHKDVVATLNGNKNITATATPIVKNRFQAEYATYTGASRPFRTKYKTVTSTNAVVVTTSEIYGHLGSFDTAALAGKEASFSINVNSTSVAVTDLNINMSNINFEDIASNANGTNRFAAAPMRLNKIMDIYVNGKLASISDESVLDFVGYANTDWSGIYHVLQDVLVKDIALNKGENTIKFQIKPHVDGEKEEKFNKVIANTNVDYVDFITINPNLEEAKTITGLKFENDETYQVGDTLAKEVKVKAIYSNGTTTLLDSSEYTLELLKDGVAVADQTKFVAGNFELKATYNDDSSITISKDISAVTYSSKSTASRLYQSGDRVYFEIKFTNVGYKVEDYVFFHYSRAFKMDSGVQSGDTLTMTVDLTNYRDTGLFKARMILHAMTMLDGTASPYYGHSKEYGDIIHSNLNASTFASITKITVDGYVYEYGRNYGPTLQITKAA